MFSEVKEAGFGTLKDEEGFYLEREAAGVGTGMHDDCGLAWVHLRGIGVEGSNGGRG